MDFVERRIVQGQRAGLFDDLELEGQSLIDLNAEIDRANQTVETNDRVDGLDVEAELAAWRARRRQRLWGHYLKD